VVAKHLITLDHLSGGRLVREPLSPQALADYLGGVVPASWDVVAFWAPGVPAGECADVGASRLIESTLPVGGWVNEFHDRVRRGPARD
jgi:hypothetical protein